MEIKLRADEAKSMAKHVQSEAGAARDQMDNLRGRLNSLTDSFTGKSQVAFDNAFNEWKSGADQMLLGLDSLGEFLSSAAATIEQTDQRIASKLSSG